MCLLDWQNPPAYKGRTLFFFCQNKTKKKKAEKEVKTANFKER